MTEINRSGIACCGGRSRHVVAAVWAIVSRSQDALSRSAKPGPSSPSTAVLVAVPSTPEPQPPPAYTLHALLWGARRGGHLCVATPYWALGGPARRRRTGVRVTWYPEIDVADLMPVVNRISKCRKSPEG